MSPRMLCELLSDATCSLNASGKPKGRAFQILSDINLALACEWQCRSFTFATKPFLWHSVDVIHGTLQARIDPSRRHQRGSARTLALAVLCLCLGIGFGMVLFHHPSKPLVTSEPQIALSSGTTQVLARLNGPVEMRFYSVLESNAAPALREFCSRVVELLDTYRQAAGGKLVFSAQTNASPNDALEDGLKSIDLGKGEGSYIGLVLVAGGKRQVLPQFSPEWEQALEADISRALANLTQTPNAQAATMHPQTTDPVSLEAVQRQIPNPASVSLEEGTRILREASMKEFSTAVTEMQAQVHGAQDRLAQAKTSGSQADQDAALKQLQAVQTANAEKLKDIAASSQARIDALKSLKSERK